MNECRQEQTNLQQIFIKYLMDIACHLGIRKRGLGGKPQNKQLKSK